MEHIPEPVQVERKWTTWLQWLIAIAVLAVWVVHMVRPDVISQTAVWLIAIPLALCMAYALFLIRRQARIR